MSFDDLLRGLQESRKQAPKILFEGALQGNTDQYYRATQLYGQDMVPGAPKPLFCENGASVEVDNRQFMSPQPQVPANPELEALNAYFSRRRVEEFARGQQQMMIGETLAKEAERTANLFVREELDRRSGIRRAVLERTGMTPAEIESQLVQESLSGVNTRTLDMRDQQITDAVNRFYNINNLPVPDQQPSANPVPASVPSNVMPVDITKGMMPEEGEPSMPAEPVPEATPEVSPEPTQRPGANPPAPENQPDFGSRDEVREFGQRASKKQLAQYIFDKQIARPDTVTASGKVKSVTSLSKLNKETLAAILINWWDESRYEQARAEGMPELDHTSY